nr:protein ROOT HAIR DEFECTIVE 3-like isoform X1 [Ipomoea batatas]
MAAPKCEPRAATLTSCVADGDLDQHRSSTGDLDQRPACSAPPRPRPAPAAPLLQCDQLTSLLRDLPSADHNDGDLDQFPAPPLTTSIDGNTCGEIWMILTWRVISAPLELTLYEAEVTFFDEGVRSAKRKQLEEKLLQAHNGKSAISKFAIRSMLENQSNV